MPSNVLECSKFVHNRKYSLYELWRFVYILGHVTLHVESIAQKVNCLESFAFNPRDAWSAGFNSEGTCLHCVAEVTSWIIANLFAVKIHF